MNKAYLNILIFLLLTIFFSCKQSGNVSSRVNNNVAQESDTLAKDSTKVAKKDTTAYVSKNYFVYNNKIYDDDIHTVQLYPVGDSLGLPVIQLNSGQLLLQFDDFDQTTKNYSYKIIFCNADWKPADIPKLQYSGGFASGFINDYAYSLNTYQPYIHYRLAFPNDELQLKIPGNYLLIVYKDNPDKPIITRRFRVYQNKVSITPDIHQATVVQDRDYNQEVDFTVTLGNLNIQDPYSDIKPVLMQNYRKDNKIVGLKPVFVKSNELVYDLDRKNNFAGGSEFHGIDLSNTKYLSQNLQRIAMNPELNRYHFYLYPDKTRAYKAYSSEQDIDGKYVIRNENGNNNETEADYVFVTFTLPYDVPEKNGSMYLLGAFNCWQMNENNRMYYDYKKQAYTLNLYLKQGYYDYAYAFLPDKSDKATFMYTEGDHFETENTYQIFIYSREINNDFDELVGYKNVKFH